MSDNVLSDVFGDAAISSPTKIKAFHKVNKNNKKELLEWLKGVSHSLQEQAEQRTRQQRSNLLMYRGIALKRRDLDRDRIYRGKRLNRVQKLVIPHVHDLTETRISQITRIKPAVDVRPANNEWEDRASAKVVELIIKHLWYTNNVDYDIQKLHRQTRIFGESYMWAEWDDYKGDLHPLYVKAKDMGLEEVTLENGKKASLKKPIKVGDIKYIVELPWRVLLQRKVQFCDVEYCFRVKLIPTERLQDKYKDKTIKASEDLRLFDIGDMTDKLLEDHTLVFEFWHKETEDVPEGFHAEFTLDKLLHSGPHPYSFKGFPFVRLTDMDLPHQLNGVSKYELIAPIANMYNNLNTLISKNIWLTAHSKWMMPRGAAKIEQLGNDNTVVQYQGPVPPTLVQAAPNPPEVYKYKDELLRDMQTIYGSHGISRGEIPIGITATSALTFLNELESQRASTEISKHGFTLTDLAKLTVSIVGDKYEIDDGRMIRIVGESNQYMIRHFDTAHLHKAYDIRFNVGTSLPDSKAGSRQIILDMMQRNPTGNSMERWEELLEVGNTEKAVDLQTAAIKSADSENEDLAAGRPVSSPEIFEDHISHWMSHSRFVQSRQFKEEMNPENRKAVLDHLFWTEEAIIDKMKNSPQFEARVAGLNLFPILNHKGYVPARGLEHQMAVVQGSANKEGEIPPGAQIPTQETPDIKR
jgi:hypothetical protein